MVAHTDGKTRSAVFITFSGNCKKALTFYQSCFGGQLRLEPLEIALQAYKEIPIVSGSLIADIITIYGSDLVHNEGRKLGNYIAVFLAFENPSDRKEIIEKLAIPKEKSFGNDDDQKLIEVIDSFGVRWALGVNGTMP